MFSNVTQTDSIQIECLHRWALKNNIKLNKIKCNAMYFKRNLTHPSNLKLGNAGIEQSKCLKTFGVDMQNNLKWYTQTVTMCNAFNNGIYFWCQLKC